MTSNVPTKMRATAIREPGDPDVLVAVEETTPYPQAHEVLIAVQAAGVNRPDCLQRKGLYPLPPDASPLPGLEVSGEVVAVGEDVSRWSAGDRVVALTHGGGYAEYCVAHEGHCLPWPTNCDKYQAAALPETTFTVQYNLFTRAGLADGEIVLIHGGSSGIGSTAIQLAKAHGATVITTAGTDAKCAYCNELGADHALNYKSVDWVAQINEITDGHGVNVVLDMVAGPYVEKNIKLLCNDGRYSMIAFLLGHQAEVNFAQVLTKRLTITGSTLRPQSTAQKAAIADSVRTTVWPQVDAGALKVPIFETFPLAEAARAHELMESSNHMGKIVLEVA